MFTRRVPSRIGAVAGFFHVPPFLGYQRYAFAFQFFKEFFGQLSRSDTGKQRRVIFDDRPHLGLFPLRHGRETDLNTVERFVMPLDLCRYAPVLHGELDHLARVRVRLPPVEPRPKVVRFQHVHEPFSPRRNAILNTRHISILNMEGGSLPPRPHYVAGYPPQRGLCPRNAPSFCMPIIPQNHFVVIPNARQFLTCTNSAKAGSEQWVGRAENGFSPENV